MWCWVIGQDCFLGNHCRVGLHYLQHLLSTGVHPARYLEKITIKRLINNGHVCALGKAVHQGGGNVSGAGNQMDAHGVVLCLENNGIAAKENPVRLRRTGLVNQHSLFNFNKLAFIRNGIQPLDVNG
jgi:hypothetical protein